MHKKYPAQNMNASRWSVLGTNTRMRLKGDLPPYRCCCSSSALRLIAAHCGCAQCLVQSRGRHLRGTSVLKNTRYPFTSVCALDGWQKAFSWMDTMSVECGRFLCYVPRWSIDRLAARMAESAEQADVCVLWNERYANRNGALRSRASIGPSNTCTSIRKANVILSPFELKGSAWWLSRTSKREPVNAVLLMRPSDGQVILVQVFDRDLPYAWALFQEEQIIPNPDS